MLPVQPPDSRLRAHVANQHGATLIDALIATALMVTVSTGAAGLLTWSTRASASAGTRTTALWLAQQKLEQLCVLEWRIDSDGVRTSDQSTSVAHDPMRNGGPGLRASPSAALDVNAPGYVDFVGADGLWRGDADPLAGAAFVRRWSITPLAGDPLDSLILTVVVRPLSEAARRADAAFTGVTLTTVRTRLFQSGGP